MGKTKMGSPILNAQTVPCWLSLSWKIWIVTGLSHTDNMGKEGKNGCQGKHQNQLILVTNKETDIEASYHMYDAYVLY